MITSKQEFIDAAMKGRVEFFGGSVICDTFWNGFEDIPLCAVYADKDGIHACPDGDEQYIDDFDPIPFDEIGWDVYSRIINYCITHNL